MAAVRRSYSSSSTSAMQRTNSAKEIAEQYSGAGKTFRVKFIGSEAVSDVKGDAAAADCMRRLRQACAKSRTQLPKTTITLQFKGLGVFDEKSKSVTLRVPVEKITYVCHDPEDVSVFAVIVRTEDGDTPTKLKLYAFKADQKSAVLFVRSARELFQLMYKLMKAKKKRSEQLEASPLPEEGRQSDSEEGQSQASAAPSVTMATIDLPPPPQHVQSPDAWVSSPPSATGTLLQTEGNIYDVPSSQPATQNPAPTEDRKKVVMQEWKALDEELKQIAKDLGMESTPTTQRHPDPIMPPTPFDMHLSGDPFSDNFFQDSFGSPASFPNDAFATPASFPNDAFGSPASFPNNETSNGSSVFMSFSNVTPGSAPVGPQSQPTTNLFTSTPEGQVVPPPMQPLHPQTLQQPGSFTVDPFQFSNGMTDRFQSGDSSGMVSNMNVNQYQGVPSLTGSYNVSAGTNTTMELSNPLYQPQDTGSFNAFSSQLQPPSQQSVRDPFGFEISGPTQHPLTGFSPQVQPAPVPNIMDMSPVSFSIGPQGTSSNLMAINPFASDLDPSSLFSTPQSSFVRPLVDSKGSTSGTASEGKDIFAELIPLAVGASPSRKPASKQTDTKLQQENPPEFGLIQFDDIKIKRTEQKSPQELPLVGERPKPESNHSFATFEDSFQDAPSQQKDLPGFDDSFQEPHDRQPSRDAEQISKSAITFEESFEEPLRQDTSASVPNGFENSFQAQGNLSTSSGFEVTFEADENDNSNTSRAFQNPNNVTPTLGSTFETGFGDHFVADTAADPHSPPSNSKPGGSSRFGDDFLASETESTSKSWIAFS